MERTPTTGMRPETALAARVIVRSAVPLDDGQRAALQALCRERCLVPSEILFEVDPAVLGGIWLRIGDMVIDGSLAGKIEQLGHHLREQLRTMASSDPQTAP